jgi:hypothetical protein
VAIKVGCDDVTVKGSCVIRSDCRFLHLRKVTARARLCEIRVISRVSVQSKETNSEMRVAKMNAKAKANAAKADALPYDDEAPSQKAWTSVHIIGLLADFSRLMRPPRFLIRVETNSSWMGPAHARSSGRRSRSPRLKASISPATVVGSTGLSKPGGKGMPTGGHTLAMTNARTAETLAV